MALTKRTIDMTKEQIQALVKMEEDMATKGYGPSVYFFDLAKTAIDALTRLEVLEREREACLLYCREQNGRKTCKNCGLGEIDEPSEGLPMFAVGNGELVNKQSVREDGMVPCSQCHKMHKIGYATDTKTGEVSKMIGFIECTKTGNSHVCAIGGKLI